MSRTSPPAEPQSPCIQVCLLDAAQVCSGCGRRIDEIGEWPSASAVRKHEILELAARRRRARQPVEHHP